MKRAILSTLLAIPILVNAQSSSVNSWMTGTGMGWTGWPQSNAVITGLTIDGTTIGATTPATGKFTTLQSTGLISPTYPSGIAGNTTGLSVSAGSIGEVITTSVSSVGLSSGASTAIATLSPTSGTWLVFANVVYSFTGLAVASALQAGVNTASSMPSTSSTNIKIPGIGLSGDNSLMTPLRVFNSSSSGTFYLMASATFTGVGTTTASAVLTAIRIG